MQYCGFGVMVRQETSSVSPYIGHGTPPQPRHAPRHLEHIGTSATSSTHAHGHIGGSDFREGIVGAHVARPPSLGEIDPDGAWPHAGQVTKLTLTECSWTKGSTRWADGRRTHGGPVTAPGAWP